MRRLLLCFFLFAPLVYAQDEFEEDGCGCAEQEEGCAEGEPAPAEELEKCTCDEGYSSYEALGCPKRAPGDPSVCPLVNRGLGPKMYKTSGLPGDHKMASMGSFLLRHAKSWNMQCSMCATWKKKKGQVREEHAEALTAAASQKKIGGKRIEVCISDHYVVVMDHPRIKITTAGGGIRVATQHELIHLFAQRAELARRDWVKVFGHPREMRSLIVLVWSESTRKTFSAKHWGNANTNLLYGGGKGGKLPGGAGNGFVLSGRNDDDLNFNTRHMVGHLCISTYHHHSPHDKHLPQWIFRGAAHWLSKLHPRAKNHAYFCSYEGVSVSGSGSRWDNKARKIAARGPSRDPVEAMFQASTAGQMKYSMHVRAWSWFDVFAAEEKEPFVRFIQQLRQAREPRVAAKEAWGQAPEYVDDRWRERVLGKRKEVSATNREKRKEVEEEEAGSRELREIARETDLQLLAGKIRGLDRCQNIKTARLLISMVDSKRSDRVREVIALVLSRTRDEEVMAHLRGRGYERAGKFGRATLCRVFGELKHQEAQTLLRSALADSFWLVQANAARALAQLGDTDSIGAVASMAASAPKPKVRIGAMDALAIYGAAAGDTIPGWERNLMHSAWQVKVATCDSFKGIGSTKALDMLIGRIDAEGGRVHDSIKRSIKSITGMERDWNREQWRKWWNHTKKFQDLDQRMKEELEKEEKRKEAEAARQRKSDERRTVAKKKDGPPTYYGIRVYARAVGYVIDVSLSMGQGFRVSEMWQERLGRKYTATSRMGVCKEEIAQAIKELDPRTRINLVFFNNRVRTWKPAPVPAGSMGANAISAVKNVQPSGQTNYYDALRAIMGLDDGGPSWRSQFPDTPDTLFFLTDGTPTDGEITKSDELLAWFNERNRFARLRVHVIAMGSTGVDIDFLSRLAKMNDGKFIHMTGDH